MMPKSPGDEKFFTRMDVQCRIRGDGGTDASLVSAPDEKPGQRRLAAFE
jgi:hypothetical protein